MSENTLPVPDNFELPITGPQNRLIPVETNHPAQAQMDKLVQAFQTFEPNQSPDAVLSSTATAATQAGAVDEGTEE